MQQAPEQAPEQSAVAASGGIQTDFRQMLIKQFYGAAKILINMATGMAEDNDETRYQHCLRLQKVCFCEKCT